MYGTRSLVSNGELMIYGVIDPRAADGNGIRAIDVIDSLASLRGDTITVRINSPGGVVMEGIAIYNALRDDRRRVVVRVDAVAASIASVIAMAGDEIIMAENASMMIHDPWAAAMGGSNDMRAMADEIDRQKGIIVNIYASRTKLDRAEIESLMSAETYMSASDAIDRKFADRVDIPLAIAACASLSKDELRRLVARELVRASTSESPVPAAAAAIKLETVEMTVENVKAAPEAAVIDEAKVRAQAASAERARVSTIMALARNAKVEDVADKLIADGVSVADAQEKIMTAWNAKYSAIEGPEIRRVEVLRDERDTMRAGMVEALSARLGSGGSVSDNAARFMDYSIVDMAADFTGHRGRYNSPAQRETLIRNAMHTTSDFPILLENALNKALMGRYEMAQPTYRQIARQRSYADFRDHISIRMGDFPTLQPVNEAGELKGGTVGETKEKTSVKAYGVQFAISRQMMVNDNLNGINQVLADYGSTVAAFEESTFFAMMLSASGAGPTLMETGRAVFNTTDKTQASSNSAINEGAVSIGRASMRKHKSVDGLAINVTPSIILVGPDKETEAQRLVAAITPAQSANVNPFSGSLRVVVSAEIVGNGWYLFADPSRMPNFEWGLLDGYSAPRLRIEEPFGVQGTKVSLEHDFGCGAINYRGGFRNVGA